MEQLYTLGKCNLLKNILLLKAFTESLFVLYRDYSFKLFIPVFVQKTFNIVQLPFTILREYIKTARVIGTISKHFALKHNFLTKTQSC
jgi:hypothetical protein